MKLNCPHCGLQRDPRSATRTIRRSGHYYRKSDGQRLNRFWCFPCAKSFSAATSSPLRWQKKRQLRRLIGRMMTGVVSQREAAEILSINRKTVVRTFRYLGKAARSKLAEENSLERVCKFVQFDDLETHIHTRLKPASVPLMVEAGTRRILGIEAAIMPARGPLAALSRKKYGHRPDERPQARKRLFESVQNLVEPKAEIWSDSNPHYPPDVKRHFPLATHHTVMGGRAAVAGQGELKKKTWDPIFSLNHTCAMLRANINRLIRKTWCTSKRLDQLELHLLIYAVKHNQRIRRRREKAQA